jgi:outer membrane biosynthesis protein TonB
MDIIRVSRNITIIAFLVSLLFHGSTILYIFLQKTNNHLHTHIEQQEQAAEPTNPQANDPWVATKARNDNFGSPVFFKDEPEIQQQEQSSSVQEDVVETHNAQQQEEQLPAQEEKTIERSDSIVPEPVQLQQTVTTKKTSPIQKNPIKNNLAQKNISQQNAGPKPPLTLAQLTQGFLNHVKEEGNYGVSILSNKTGLPSEQQLKYERYLQKLGWCLQNSYNINSDRCSPIAKDAVAHIFLSLNRDGSVKHLNVAQSSGNIHIDQFILFIFRDAGSSFPPVPQYLPDDPFAITYAISIGTTSDGSMRFYRR